MNTTFNLDHLTNDILDKDLQLLATFVSDGSDYSNIVYEVIFVDSVGYSNILYEVIFPIINGNIDAIYDIEIFNVSYYKPKDFNAILALNHNENFKEIIMACYKSTRIDKLVKRIDYE